MGCVGIIVKRGHLQHTSKATALTCLMIEKNMQDESHSLNRKLDSILNWTEGLAP